MFSLIRRFLKGPALVCAVFAPLCMALEVLMDLQQPTLMADIIDKGVALRDLHYVVVTGGRMILYALIGLAGGAGCAILAVWAAFPFAGVMRRNLFGKIQTLQAAEIDKLQTASLITRMTNDVVQVQRMLQMLLRAIRGPLICVGGIVMAFMLSRRLALILLAAMPVLVVAVTIIVTRAVPLFSFVQQRMDGINTVMRENLLGVRVVKAFCMEGQQFTRFGEANEKLTAANIRAQSATFLMTPVVALVMNLSIVAALWFGGYMQTRGQIPTGHIMAFVNYLVQITNAMGMMVNMIMTFSRATASAARINEVLDTEPSIVESAGTEKPSGYEIVFSDVSFRYNAGDDVLRGLSFTLAEGAKVGIIGATGSGKSTLINLIARLYDPQAGTITIGGTDVKKIPLKTLRRMVGLVPQGNLLFSGSIADNLRYGDDRAGEEELWQAVETAQAAEFLETMEKKLESPVEQRGRNFSGGQKQRLAVARTVLRKSDILILDDASSALDLETDAKMRQALERTIKAPGRSGTLIMIAQRVSSLMDCDKILVLDQGRLAASGTHRELLDSCEIYRSIAVSQLGEEALAHV